MAYNLSKLKELDVRRKWKNQNKPYGKRSSGKKKAHPCIKFNISSFVLTPSVVLQLM